MGLIGVLCEIEGAWFVKYNQENLPILKEKFDINNPNPIVVLKEGKEVEFEAVDEKYAKLIK
jgi:hypothetical protein